MKVWSDPASSGLCPTLSKGWGDEGEGGFGRSRVEVGLLQGCWLETRGAVPVPLCQNFREPVAAYQMSPGSWA